MQPPFERLLKHLDTPAFHHILCDKFDVNVMDLPMMITLRGYSRQKDGHIHTDSKTKVLTILIYLNEEWAAATGKLRVLRNKNDMDDIVTEIEPGPGNQLSSDAVRFIPAHQPLQGVYDLVLLQLPKTLSLLEYQLVALRRRAARHLSAQGTFIIVANRHLDYRPLLQPHFLQVKLVTGNNKFVILCASGPKAR